MKVSSESGVISATQHPAGQSGLENIQKADLGASLKLAGLGDDNEVEPAGEKPVFVVPLPSEVVAGDDSKLHFECQVKIKVKLLQKPDFSSIFKLNFQVEPVKDPSLKVTWYHNGLPLTSGSRIRASHEFGQVTLDIDDIGARDQVPKNGLFVMNSG